MPKVKADDQGKLILPDAFLDRWHISSDTEYWLDEREGDLIFHPDLSAPRGFHFPSCPDCGLRESYDIRERNEGCWRRNPSCADCLWVQDIIRCP
jgi:hypothetical protein